MAGRSTRPWPVSTLYTHVPTTDCVRAQHTSDYMVITATTNNRRAATRIERVLTPHLPLQKHLDLVGEGLVVQVAPQLVGAALCSRSRPATLIHLRRNVCVCCVKE